MAILDRTGTKLRLESLEQKRLLAGDVTVDIIDGMLRIAGDASDNQIEITTGENPAEVTVRGLRSPTSDDVANEGDVTTINGGAEVTITGVTAGVRVNMKAGDDLVRIPQGHFRNLMIQTGSGDDRVVMGNGEGRPDDAATEEVDAFGDSDTTGEETQGEDLGDRSRPAVHVGRNLLVSTGPGDDIVRAQHLSVGRHLLVHTGAGDDRVGLGGADPEHADSDVPLPEDSDAIRDGDRVRGAALQVGGRAFVNVGPGDDSVRVAHARVRSLAINAGEGDDQVAVVDSAFGTLTAWMGAGDDTLALRDTKVFGVAGLFGGPGQADTLRWGEGNEIRRKWVRGFELPSAGEGNSDKLATDDSGREQRRRKSV